MGLPDELTKDLELFEKYLKSEFSEYTCGEYQGEAQSPCGRTRLNSAVHYGLFSGGKRFRPLVSMLTARALGKDPREVHAFAMAVEMIHSYSLIHDDLPLMDDDDERRGRPTAHKVYGDAMVLLAGDALLTEAFQVLAKHYGAQNSKAAIEAVNVLSMAAGIQGMVAGQALDIIAASSGLNADQIKEIHTLKTGKLIAVAAEGAAIVCEAAAEERKALKSFGEALGLAFQLADDILDDDEQNPEASGFPAHMGLGATKAALQTVSDGAVTALGPFGENANGLRHLITYNLERKN